MQSAVAISCAAFVGIGSALASAGTVWDGDGGGANSRWSNPLNWSPDGVPPPNSSITLTIGGIGVSNQDLGDPFPVFDLTFASQHSVFGGPLRVLGNVYVTHDDLYSTVVYGGIEFPWGTTITTPVGSLSFGRALDLSNTSGAGVLTVSGAVMLQGNTTFDGPVNAVGRLVTIGHVIATEDYTVTSGAFFGSGTMSFAQGKRLDVTGTLAPGMAALPADPGHLLVEGDVRLRGMLEVELPHGPFMGFADRLDVTGTFDMQGTLFTWASPQPGQYLIGTYGNRIGSLTLDRPGMSLLFTSGENAGPGEIYLIVPEPAAMLLSPIVALCLLRARRSRVALRGRRAGRFRQSSSIAGP